MKKNLINLSLTAIGYFLLLAATVSAQTTVKADHELVSGFNKKAYRLNVLLPAAYSAKDTLRYPVLYVLDGDYSAGLFQSTLSIFSLAPELKDVIVVTIDGVTHSREQWLASRYYDYTPSSDPQADTGIARFMKTAVVPSGGAAAFLSTLEKQILPWVESTYKTNEDKALYGHSLGGLFAAYCLVQKPTLFKKYSINSPSLWWRQGELANQYAAMKIRPEQPGTVVFLSAGKKEGPFMLSPIEVFEKAIHSNLPAAKLTYKIFDDETHLSVVPVICSRTLSIFYSRMPM
jgi:predicted alpha/beta superfamily hydrolase